MSEQTVSGFIISLILVGGIVATLAVYYAGAATSASTTYDETTFNTYNQLSAINNTAEDLRDSMDNLATGGILEKLDGLIMGGWNTLKVTWQSFGVFTTMTNDASNQVTKAIPGSTILITALIMAAFIAFVFIFISAIMGRKL